jgi:hypothetical protein
MIKPQLMVVTMEEQKFKILSKKKAKKIVIVAEILHNNILSYILCIF